MNLHDLHGEIPFLHKNQISVTLVTYFKEKLGYLCIPIFLEYVS